MNTFNAIKRQHDFPDAILPIYNYFESTYINGTPTNRFEINIWNVADEDTLGIARTNNALEGYHNSLKSMFYYKSYSFVNLIYNLKLTESNMRILDMIIQLNDPPIRKREYM